MYAAKIIFNIVAQPTIPFQLLTQFQDRVQCKLAVEGRILSPLQDTIWILLKQVFFPLNLIIFTKVFEQFFNIEFF